MEEDTQSDPAGGKKVSLKVNKKEFFITLLAFNEGTFPKSTIFPHDYTKKKKKALGISWVIRK